jgi:predicted nucleic acid-binding protein
MPNRILPDTCAWIDFFKARTTTLAEKLKTALTGGTIVSCGIVMYELLQGIRTQKEEELVISAFQALPQLEMTAASWIQARRLSADLRKKGHTIPLSDIIIAALALKNDCAVLTIDHHFDLIPNLKIIRGA